MTPSDDSHDDLDRAFPIVGIGASAGGLEAFKFFLQALPADSGLAFVFTQHLDPTHESMMVDLLAKHTAMPVLAARAWRWWPSATPRPRRRRPPPSATRPAWATSN